MDLQQLKFPRAASIETRFYCAVAASTETTKQLTIPQTLGWLHLLAIRLRTHGLSHFWHSSQSRLHAPVTTVLFSRGLPFSLQEEACKHAYRTPAHNQHPSSRKCFGGGFVFVCLFKECLDREKNVINTQMLTTHTNLQPGLEAWRHSEYSKSKNNYPVLLRLSSLPHQHVYTFLAGKQLPALFEYPLMS